MTMTRIADWRRAAHAAGRTAAAAVARVVALAATALLLALGPSHAGAKGPAAYEGYAELSGVRLWYVDTGGYGPVVVLLHSNTGTSQTWKPQYGPLSAAGYRVIAFDRRGWGKSLANPATGPQPGTIAEDLHMLVERLGIRRFHLVGIAGGTFAALDYAALHPDRVVSLVAAASTASLQDPEEVAYRARITPPGFGSLPSRFRELSPSYLGANPQGTAEWESIDAQARQPNSPSQPLVTPNTYAKLERIATRTLLMAGDADLYAPPDLMRQWGSYLPNAEYVLVREAGHMIAWEQPEVFNRCTLKFLRGFRGDDLFPAHGLRLRPVLTKRINRCASDEADFPE